MSRTNELILLVPGETAWEIWSAPRGGAFSLHAKTEAANVGEVDPLPNGEIHLLFPVKSITSVPMKVASDDESLFPDLAAMHAEKLGLRPDPMAGQLTDLFPIAQEDENTALLSIILKAPGEGELPMRGPKGFDLSVRAYPVASRSVCVWQELDRWVFAIWSDGKLVHCQATSFAASDEDPALAREIRLALMQLSMQGMALVPDQVLLWGDDAQRMKLGLAAGLNLPVETSPRPDPILPDPPSKLLPADVRAARAAAILRRNTRLAVAAIAMVYLGVIIWFGAGLWKTRSETKRFEAQAAEMEPASLDYATHVAKWDELAPAIDLNLCPVDIFYRIHRSIPLNSGLRLSSADVSAYSVKLRGEAPQSAAVTQFNLALGRNNDLARFRWSTPEPSQSTRGWEFNYSGDMPDPTTEG